MNESKEITSNVLDFWFSTEIKGHWFSSTPEIDNKILTDFESLWKKAKAGKLNKLKESAEGCLTLCIILDQFPLNMYRNTAESFSTEQQAVAITKYAIENALDTQLNDDQIMFLYMPLMHSEDMDDQNLSVQSFEKRGLNSHFSIHHRDIVKAFGRFPHRNHIIGRKNSDKELEYLASDKAFTG